MRLQKNSCVSRVEGAPNRIFGIKGRLATQTSPPSSSSVYFLHSHASLSVATWHKVVWGGGPGPRPDCLTVRRPLVCLKRGCHSPPSSAEPDAGQRSGGGAPKLAARPLHRGRQQRRHAGGLLGVPPPRTQQLCVKSNGGVRGKLPRPAQPPPSGVRGTIPRDRE